MSEATAFAAAPKPQRSLRACSSYLDELDGRPLTHHIDSALERVDQPAEAVAVGRGVLHDTEW